MNTGIDFYRSQAAEAMRQAGEAALPSVRERCERSAAAWQAMIERVESFEEQKAKNLAAKSAAA